MNAFALVFTVIGIVIALFWIALPFLVFGTNGRLDELIEEVRALRGAVERQQSSVSPPSP